MRALQRVGFIVLFWIYASTVFAVTTEPQELVKSVATQTLERVKKDKEIIKSKPTHINELINELVLPHFDFERMAKWVLGKNWRQTNADQQQRFVAEFKQLLIRTYANSLLEYSDQEIIYLPFRNANGEEVTVRSEIAQPGGFPIPIHYKLYKPIADWKVFDVIIDDVSLVSNYRTSFSKEIRETGIEGLIKKLADGNKR